MLKCKNVNICWHFNIYKHEINVSRLSFISIIITASESFKARKVFILSHFSIDKNLKFHAQLS